MRFGLVLAVLYPALALATFDVSSHISRSETNSLKLLKINKTCSIVLWRPQLLHEESLCLQPPGKRSSSNRKRPLEMRLSLTITYREGVLAHAALVTRTSQFTAATVGLTAVRSRVVSWSMTVLGLCTQLRLRCTGPTARLKYLKLSSLI